MRTAARFVCLVLVAGLIGGCTAFRSSIKEKDPDGTKPLTGSYDQRDLLTMADEMTKLILAHPFPPASAPKPLVVAMGIQNRTKSHIDTKALEDTLVTRLLDTKNIDFVDASTRDTLLKEQGYQLKNCTPETCARIGKQLGAKYMLTGSLSEIEHQSGREVRVSKQQDVYYQFTAELTDLETGVLVLRKQYDRMRRVSKPLFGW